MPATDIASGSTETIINEEEAEKIAEGDEYVGIIIEISSNPVRIAVGEEEEQARHGLPLDVDDILTVDPRGHEIVAHGDGAGTSTVDHHALKFAILDYAGL